MVVRFEMRDAIGLITLAKPDRHNALACDLVEAMVQVLQGTEAEQAKAIVIAGEGRSFCAGADIRDLLNAGWMTPNPKGRPPMDLFEALDTDPRVTIAAVHGLVLGGGFELTLCCDLVVSASDATFSLPEVGHGVVPNTGVTRLTQMVGPRRALDLILTRRRITADEANALGLITRVVPASDVVDHALKLAADITAAAPPGALAVVKQAVRCTAPLDWAQVRSMLKHIPSEEWTEGLSAFQQKRRPDYENFWRKRNA